MQFHHISRFIRLPAISTPSLCLGMATLPVVKRHACEKKCRNMPHIMWDQDVLVTNCTCLAGPPMQEDCVLICIIVHPWNILNSAWPLTGISGISNGQAWKDLQSAHVCANGMGSMQKGSFDPQPQEFPTLRQHQSCKVRSHVLVRGLGNYILSLSMSKPKLGQPLWAATKMVILIVIIWFFMVASGLVSRTRNSRTSQKTTQRTSVPHRTILQWQFKRDRSRVSNKHHKN